MPTYTTSAGQAITTTGELGKGGEGTVSAIIGHNDIVAKIYHPSHRTLEKERKLQAMIVNPPRDDTRRFSPPHISIAWPTEVVYEQGRFAGYLMPLIVQSPDIFKFYNPQVRARNHPAFDWRYLHRTATNLATALNALHARGCVMGDVNQKNVLVTTSALVSIVDTDSFQVNDANGQVYRCPVGVPEYTPPELQGVRLDSTDRSTQHDCFGLAVISFQLLMEGFHPFAGAPQDPTLSLVGELYLHCIKQGIFPYQPNNQFNPPPNAPDFDMLHPETQNLFLRCFVNGHKNPSTRPTAREWIDALGRAESALEQCRQNSSHWYSNHLGKCPWCERDSRRSLPIQQGLPPIQTQTQAPVHTAPRQTTGPKPPRGTYTPTPQPPVKTKAQPPMKSGPLPPVKPGRRRGRLLIGAVAVGLIGVLAYTSLTGTTGFTLSSTLTGHADDVDAVAFSPDGRLLASVSEYEDLGSKGTVKLWNPQSGEPLRTIGEDYVIGRYIAFSPDGRRLASGGEDALSLWDPQSGELLQDLEAYPRDVLSVAFSSDGRLLASGDDDGPYGENGKLWHTQSGEPLQTLEIAGSVRSTAFSPDGNLLASSSEDDGTVRLWDLQTGELLQTLSGHSDGVRSVAFSPDGRLLASGSSDNTVKLWDPQSGEPLQTLSGHSRDVHSVAFSPDRHLLASGSDDQTVKLWDPQSGELLQTLENESSVLSAAFSPDGRLLATGSEDETVRIWESTGDDR